MKNKQLELAIYKGRWGGRRPGSGRKRIHSKGVAHRTREKVSARSPLHINFKFQTSIRNKETLRVLKRAIINARSHGLRIIHYSMQRNHVHFIIEADRNALLTRGMRSLTITFAKGLRQGKVQIERYHLHVLKSVRETRNAIHYVLFNQQKHEKGTYSEINSYSSLLCLDGALKLVAQFATRHRLYLKIREKNDWVSDDPISYLLRRTLKEITV